MPCGIVSGRGRFHPIPQGPAPHSAPPEAYPVSSVSVFMRIVQNKTKKSKKKTGIRNLKNASIFQYFQILIPVWYFNLGFLGKRVFFFFFAPLYGDKFKLMQKGV